jgi:hypothetical protein
MPAAPNPKTITRKAAIPSRKTPPKIADHPIHKKSCFPCITPENIGIQNENSSRGKVTTKPAKPGNRFAGFAISIFSTLALVLLGAIGLFNAWSASAL